MVVERKRIVMGFVFVVICIFSLVSPGRCFWFDERSESSLGLPDDVDMRKTVRVAVVKNASSASLDIPSRFTVRTIETREVLRGLQLKGPQNVRPTVTGVTIGNEIFKIYGVRIEPEGKEFTLDGRAYRGHLVIIREKNNTLLCVNYIDIDEYLKGVLPKEVDWRWGMSSLKAQAIASRTFALFTELSRAGRDYSLEKTVSSQVYGGKTSEQDETSAAVELTKGQVLVYKEKIFPAYFHACCGGMLTRCDHVWNIKPHPCLREVVSPFCIDTKHYAWETKISVHELSEKLRKKGYSVGTVKDVQIRDIDKSGRPLSVVVTGDVASTVLKSNTFRLLVGPEVLRSTRLKSFTMDSQQLTFKGNGWGHGVGLCQWCAKVMADKGYTYQQILAHFYPDSTVTKIY